MRLTRYMALITGLLMAALLAVACGGDDPDPTATPTPQPAPAAATATPTPADAMEPTEPAATPTPLPPGVTPPPPTPTPTSPPPPTATPIPGFDPEEHFKNKRISINVGFSPAAAMTRSGEWWRNSCPSTCPATRVSLSGT